MFRFHFDLEDGVDETAVVAKVVPPEEAPSTLQQAVNGIPFAEIEIDSLLEALPTRLSYSFVSTPSSDGRSPDLKLARRDLFDARFQLMSEETDDPQLVTPQAYASDPSFASALQFIDHPSDLVPLVYEGGLKTWECSLDLASCLRRDGHTANAKGQRVLELGCGTAIPTLCLLQGIFSSSPTNDTETHMHLQDYNASVLQLVTLPNVVLTWWLQSSLTTAFTDTSLAAAVYRSSEADVPGDVDVDSELYITPQLIHAFKTSLREHGLYLRFFSGSWDTFDLRHTGGPYHLVLTSETIYCPDSLPSLVRVLRDACSGDERAYGCIVAAKTVYFGVGGGIAELVRCVESLAVVGEQRDDSGGRVETIWETSTGVNRKVMRVRWT